MLLYIGGIRAVMACMILWSHVIGMLIIVVLLGLRSARMNHARPQPLVAHFGESLKRAVWSGIPARGIRARAEVFNPNFLVSGV